MCRFGSRISSADVVQVLPAAVGEEDRNHRGPEGERERHGRQGRCCAARARDRRRPGHHHEGCADQDHQRDHLEDHENVQHPTAGFHPQVVDDGEKEDRRDGKRHRADIRPANQPQRVLREGDRDGRHRAALDDHEQAPAVQEARQRVIGVAQVGILPANPREQGAQFRVRQRADERHHAAGHPRGENQRGRRKALSDDVGIDEDAGADGRPDDDHRRIERSERAAERHRRSLPRGAGRAPGPRCDGGGARKRGADVPRRPVAP